MTVLISGVYCFLLLTYKGALKLTKMTEWPSGFLKAVSSSRRNFLNVPLELSRQILRLFLLKNTSEKEGRGEVVLVKGAGE